MPEYEVRQITLENVKKTPFVMKAIEMKNYALAGHYARVQELYENGGIYFDIDIEAVRRFDGLLGESMVVGLEDDKVVNNAVIIARQGHSFLKDCMTYMDSFDINAENVELETGPRMFTKLMKVYGWRKGMIGIFGRMSFRNILTYARSLGKVRLLKDDIKILPPPYFYPYHYTEKYSAACIVKDTLCVHHWANSWGIVDPV